jgi:hypothetical protein
MKFSHGMEKQRKNDYYFYLPRKIHTGKLFGCKGNKHKGYGKYGPYVASRISPK